MRVPPLCPQATGISCTLNLNFRARKRISGSNPQRSIFCSGKIACTAGCLKGLEAALRIFELQAQGDAQQHIEDSAEELAMQRLALGLGFGAEPARSDGDIRALLQRVQKVSEPLRWAMTGQRR